MSSLNYLTRSRIDFSQAGEVGKRGNSPMKANVYAGRGGESSLCGYLQSLGFSAAKPEPDTFGTDITAIKGVGSSSLSAVVFLFQVKTHKGGIDQRVCDVSKRFLRLACEYPAIVAVTNGNRYNPKWWFCSAFEWMKDNPTWAISSSNSVSLAPKYFDQIESQADEGKLIRLLEREASRASHITPSVWTPSLTGLNALTVEEVFAFLGQLRFVEPTYELINAIRDQLPAPADVLLVAQLREIRRGRDQRTSEASTESPIWRWLRSWPERPSSLDAAHDADTVRAFFRAVSAWEQGQIPRIARYKWSEVAVWRTLLDVWPAAFGVVEQAISEPARWSLQPTNTSWSFNEVKAAFGLASSMAHSRDQTARERAQHALQRIAGEVRVTDAAQSQQRYEVQHQLLFSLAQADTAYNGACADFIANEGPRDDRELILNRNYYDCPDDSAFFASIVAKLRMPRVRDVAMAPVLEAQHDLVTRNGFLRQSRV